VFSLEPTARGNSGLRSRFERPLVLREWIPAAVLLIYLREHCRPVAGAWSRTAERSGHPECHWSEARPHHRPAFHRDCRPGHRRSSRGNCGRLMAYQPADPVAALRSKQPVTLGSARPARPRIHRRG
jgi:hypothetical protein